MVKYKASQLKEKFKLSAVSYLLPPICCIYVNIYHKQARENKRYICILFPYNK